MANKVDLNNHGAVLCSSTALVIGCDQHRVPHNTGTGFFYSVQVAEDEHKMFLVTNRHVAASNVFAKIVLSAWTASDDVIHRDVYVRLLGYGGTKGWQHPNPEVDLYAVDITQHILDMQQEGLSHRLVSINRHWLALGERRTLLTPIENVVVVGYPRGLWDSVNNMPITRIGCTASSPFVNYGGKPDFLVDAAVFSGSSGSPVFVFEAPMFRVKGGYTPGVQATLVGILHSTMSYSEEGSFMRKLIPSMENLSDVVPTFQQGLHLGVALHADLLLDLDRAYGQKV